MNLTFLISVYNEEDALPGLVENFSALWARTGAHVLFVNDGSTDTTLLKLEALARGNPRIGYIDLSRNFGKEQALAAGMSAIPSGQNVIVMDGDGQHTAKAAGALLAAADQSENTDIVFGVRKERLYQGFIDRTLSNAFYKVANSLLRSPLDPRLGDFFFARAHVVDTLKAFAGSKLFWKGVYSYIGYERAEVPIDIAEREAGQSKFSLFRRLGLAIDGIVWLSKTPLHIISFLGLLISALSFGFAAFIVVQWLLTGVAVPGFYTIIVLQSFGVGIIMLSLGIMALYLSVVFENTSQKPGFILSRRSRLPQWDKPDSDRSS